MTTTETLQTISQDPEFYKNTPKEKFNINNQLEDIFKPFFTMVPTEDIHPLLLFLEDCINEDVSTASELSKMFLKLRKKHKRIFKKNHVHFVLKNVLKPQIPADSLKYKNIKVLESLLVKKAQRSTSGVLVVTVFTAPYPHYNKNGKTVKQRFTCKWNCYYCPDEPGQPRSYLHDEPGVLRANRNNFDPVMQFFDRVMTLYFNGHPVDKIELIVLGGTWSSYPHEYQEEFIRDNFYAANVFYEVFDKVFKAKFSHLSSGNMGEEEIIFDFDVRSFMREKKSLDEEKRLNEVSQCKIIETRPDCISLDEIRRFRKYGCTRVQLGVQHTHFSVLKKINRECYTPSVITALRLLKNCCYKVDVHLMPNLPGANPTMDKEMFHQMLYDSRLQVDQWKIYPCELVPWTIIQKWYKEGSYIPYDEGNLLDVIKYVKRRMHPWIRLNRIVRDIPSQYVIGGVNNPSMRQGIAEAMAIENPRYVCRCIRCREVKGRKDLTHLAQLRVRTYLSSEGIEYFISFETPDDKFIFGFVRLRVPKELFTEKNLRFYNNLENVADGLSNKLNITETAKSDINLPSNANGFGVVNGYNCWEETPETKQKRRLRARTTSGGHISSLGSVQEVFPELKGCALVRELHVYGQLTPVNLLKEGNGEQQHVGFGKRLMRQAEVICKDYENITSLAVISGVGVRNFYRGIGYKLTGESEMMIKPVNLPLYQQYFESLSSRVLILVAGFCMIVFQTFILYSNI
eukprot:snap_masked-scaffold_2-processed-gene-10.17-mRNA-1 protein AED:0.02 eAED:0.03 QI:0/0/0/1/1/1/2/0/740